MTAIVPTGAPAWVRSVSHVDYGGDTNKTNWLTQGVVNARTDVGAEALCRLAEDLACCVRTAPWATLTLQCNDGGSPAAPTVLAINQMTGVRIISYAGDNPPSGFPGATRNGNGDVTITWATSYQDDYGVSGSINIVHAKATIRGITPLSYAYQLVDGNSDGLSEAIRVRVFDLAGVAAASPSFTLSVVTGTS